MTRRGIRLGSLFGITVQVDWSLLIVFFLIASSLAGGVFPQWHPDWSGLQAWTTAIAAAALFFASVYAHEMSHALVGRVYGIPVHRITLFVFGGVAELEREPDDWRGELWMAIAGPIASILIGIACLGIASLFTSTSVFALDAANLGTASTLLLWLGQVNLVLALFNLVPGFPLDGGRVLRAAVWGATGDLAKATRVAARAGQGFAGLLIGSGFAMMLGLSVPVLGEGYVSGLWTAFIGWFLYNAALQSYRRIPRAPPPAS
jgi:Zn-dependent protease